MQAKADTVVSIDYTLKGNDGEVIDTSEGREPLAYLHGHGNIIPGLEKALEGKSEGEELQVKVEPEEGYGPHRQELVQQVSMEAFAGIDEVEPGMKFNAESAQGPLVVKVTDVEDDQVTIDANHDLAGQALNFDVTVRDVRDASPEELEQGQVAG
ncbi:MAG: peptidylprolyl isomerase [Wenzhouxiangellaceae bacterium]|jgi:FKBP-type peptidyl-prolyl cis-trans isomerase SlyD|nr:peptidylprolyl isomerase [Wenzhouxiangellaceae bacterium]MBS3747260.1 peptidylprolyl isomerase [Wenzhouxiangellaceae bacterium]MBS3823937.1 peptidylprolyl isomerase [Wenzhouxiangellaceae bacterium]